MNEEFKRYLSKNNYHSFSENRFHMDSKTQTYFFITLTKGTRTYDHMTNDHSHENKYIFKEW